MVKRTNRIHNLNKMILEYKREQQKFEVMEEEICNQQKEIENLRQLILSTNFMNQNPAGCSSTRTIDSAANSFSSSYASSSAKRPSLGKATATKQPNKDLIRSKQASQKAKVYPEKRPSQAASQQVEPSLRQANRSASEFKQFDQNKDGDQRARLGREPDASKAMESGQDRRLPSTKPKGLQTINKNVLNQKDNKYLLKCPNDKFGKTSEPKKELIERKSDDLIKLNDSPAACRKSDELLSRIAKLKSTGSHKFENQENPIKECLGINKSSKGINKKARPVKSALKATKSSSSMNRIHLL